MLPAALSAQYEHPRFETEYEAYRTLGQNILACELACGLAGRVRAEREAERDRIRAFVEYYIRFDNGQQHRHSWHSLQDLFEAIDKAKPVDKYVASHAPVTMRLAKRKADAEREACAKVAESMAEGAHAASAYDALRECANAIRGRKGEM